MKIPSPKDLQPLLDAAREITGPCPSLEVQMILRQPDGVFRSRYIIAAHDGELFGIGDSPEDALTKLVTAVEERAGRRARDLQQARAEVARLEALQ